VQALLALNSLFLFLSILSSFLLTASPGKECWKGGDADGKLNPAHEYDARQDWDTHVRGFQLDPPRRDDSESMCHYIANSSEEVGMRVYVSLMAVFVHIFERN